MKVVQIIDTLEVGGAEKIAVLLANLSEENGCKSSLITLLNSGILQKELSEKVLYYNLNRASKWSFSAARKFFAFIEEYDVLQIHLRHNLKWVLFWGSILGIRGKIIFHDHGNTPLPENFLFKLWKNRIHHIIVNKEIYLNKSNQFFSNTYYLHNISKIYPPNGEFKSDSSLMRLVEVSNIREIKNIRFSLQLLAKLSIQQKVLLHIYYSNAEPEYLQKVQQEIQYLGLKDIVSLIKGEINPQKFYWQYDLGLHTSHLESGPLTILEYMGHGLPFVSFDTGQSIELIREVYPEMIVSDYAIESWITNITLISNKRRGYYSSKLIELYNRNCSPQNYYLRWKNIVETALH